MPEERHYAVIDVLPRKLTITHEGQVIAETQNALILKEVGRSVYNPVYYIPQADIRTELEMEEGTKGFCPIKGHSNHWHLAAGRKDMYFGWSYEDPLPRSRKIKGHVTFNNKYVTYTSAPLED